ncbi:hypothetical protein XMA152_002045 [Marinobacterium sp. xm-a-152]|jgi:hypothetical protein|nr:hypothetical protein [Marinobacterium sp. xm-a-152]
MIPIQCSRIAVEAIRKLIKDGASIEQLPAAVQEVLGTQLDLEDIREIQLKQIAEII